MHGLTYTLKNADWCRLRKSHFESATAVPLQYPLSKHIPNFSDVHKGKYQGDSGLVNNLARILAPAFLSITQFRQSQGNFW
jgi:hypothetical protein